MNLLLPATDLQTITFIYGLYDPVTDQLRYVGKTINPTKRYLTHVTSPHSSLKDWVMSLAAIALRPEMRILEQCTGDGSVEEMQWIERSFDAGCDLLNRHGARVVNPCWPKIGRRPIAAHNRKKQMQFGRVPEPIWQELKQAAALAGKPFTQWALEILLEEARRMLALPGCKAE